MRILLIAPQPFYQERGTPIAVDMLAKALSERGDEVDILCFNEGEDRYYPHVNIIRVRSLKSVSNVKPGFSAKKLILDFFLFLSFIKLMFKHKYDVVHAIEESSFMAMLVCPVFRVRYIFDMDSSMATQLLDKFSWLGKIEPVMRYAESLPIRNAHFIVPMCDSLADMARRYRKQGIFILKDVSLVKVNEPGETLQAAENLKETLGIQDYIAMYIGNLETYQGIDLLLDAAQNVLTHRRDIHFVIIGGSDSDIQKYREQVNRSQLEKNVHIIGTRPLEQIGLYMLQADMLLSPRIKGENTPMKVYSYLDSGVPVIATDLPTHTQVMNPDISILVKPDPLSMAEGILAYVQDPGSYREVPVRAKQYITREHSYSTFKDNLYQIYAQLD